MNAATYLEEQSRLVNTYLDRYTTPATAPSLSEAPPSLLEAMRYSLMGGGKRLRPVLVIAAAKLFGVPAERVMPTACALELIHTYSLIHDDLPAMDDDDLRRGRPTSHKVFGEAVAILAGDALLTMAFELAGRQARVPGVTAEQAAQVVVEIASGAGPAGMVGGQVEDLTWEGRSAGEAQLIRIHRLKTGALIRTALRCGAILGGASAADLDRLTQYADHFGLAFQIQDDVLDVAGDAAKTGKGVGRDAKHQKSTYVSLFGLEGARVRARAEVAAARTALTNFGQRADALVTLVQFVIDREG